ncbi:MAG: hypothetical protein LBV72_14590 [Tannerella sp.]|jgi:hypothetical protein|nr:hypothetical protein [Tannerella sp.]
MMKRFFISALCTILFVSFNNIQAQDLFFLDKEGAEAEYAIKDAKGNITSYAKTIVTKVDKKDAKNFTITYTSEAFDKNKKSYAAAVTVTTEIVDGKIKQDPVASMGEAGANAEFTGTYPEFPSELSVGQEFGVYEYTLKMSGMSTKASGKSKVTAQESITTDAGSFDCYKVESESTSKVMMTTTNINTTAWYAKNVGAVKTETYDKKGKLMSAMELVSLKK